MKVSSWIDRGLIAASLLGAVVMVTAAVNFDLIFVLFSAHHQNGRTNSELANFLVPMTVGALPLLITALFIARTALSSVAGTRASQPRTQTVDKLLKISGIGLPVLALWGFLTNFLATSEVLPAGSPPAAALYVYQFTYAAALIGDALILVVAMAVRKTHKG